MSGAVPQEPTAAGEQRTPGEQRTAGADFRPELEGLRAVAVGLVLAYHAGIPKFHGGYVGVDVFFVLSGFLITGLIVRELRATGRLDLPAFYARRARRLLPAAAVALAGTLVLSVFLLPPLRLPDVAGDAAAASLYVSNLRFALQATDYLASDLAPSPLLHFWSLGVEEQFYVFWPALLLVTAAVAGRLGRGADKGLTGRLSGVVVAVTVASFVGSLALTTAAQPWAFFSLPTRAWELALGAAIALGAGRLARMPAVVGGLLVAAGLVLVAAAGILLEQSTPFPGTAALLPTVGAALVIAGGAAGASTLPSRLLALPPMRFLGRISYSLYLWHWPILVLPAAAIDAPLPLPARLALAGVAIVVAAASQRWVEDPIRQGRFVGRRVGRTLALAGATSVCVALLAVGVGSAATASLPSVVAQASEDPDGLPPDPLGGAGTAPGPGPGSSDPSPPARPTSPTTVTPGSSARPPTLSAPVPRDLTPSLAEARSDAPAIYADGCHVDQPTIEPKPCVFGDRSADASIALFGDSHAAQWFPALDRLARVEGWKLVTFTKSACTPADLTVWNPTFQRAYTECDAWRERVFAALAELRPTVVLIAMSRAYVVIDGASTATVAERPDLWDAGIAASLARLSAVAEHVVLMGDTPKSRADPAACLSRNRADSLACATPLKAALSPARTAADARLAAAAGATFIDPGPWTCPTDPCPAVIGHYLVFRDSHHLTTAFSTALSRRILDALPGPPALPRPLP
ncbi:MAG TPA: acyltransferase family protein [Patescibacteria group bacterium]|nr:acyltransferase family protein [Patescibacteria group bacterium]